MKKRRSPSTTEGLENMLINLSYEIAEKLLREGKASSQIIQHFLKMGSTSEILKREKEELEKKLIEAKTESMINAEKNRSLYEEALKAFSRYRGDDDEVV